MDRPESSTTLWTAPNTDIAPDQEEEVRTPHGHMTVM